MEFRIHNFRKAIDAVIQESFKVKAEMDSTPGARPASIVVTKLEEGKMWAGKILEAMGSPYPDDLADKA